jgi:hypothetical protein
MALTRYHFKKLKCYKKMFFRGSMDWCNGLQ